jgi:hypothetical protein
MAASASHASANHRDKRLAELTRRPRGHVTLGQLTGLGYSKDWWQLRVRRGSLEKVHPNVVRSAATERTDEGDVVAACLAIPGDAYASHTTAAALWGLGECELGGEIHITVPKRSRRSLEGVTIHLATNLRPYDRTILRRVPIVGVDRTIFDAAGRGDAEQAEDLVLDGIRLGRTSERDLRATAQHVGNLKGSRYVRRTLARLDPENVRRLLSWLERRMYALSRRAGLPLPQVNVRLTASDGTLVGLLDMRWPGVVAEVDGLRFHSTRRQKEYDDARQNGIILSGVLVLRYSDGDIREDPHRVVEEIHRALALAEELGLDRRSPSSGSDVGA